MLVFLVSETEEGGARYGTALRDRLGVKEAPAAWVDGIGLASTTDPVGVGPLARGHPVLEAAIDALEGLGVRRYVVGITPGMGTRAPELAFFLKRRAAQRCFQLTPVGDPGAWAAGAAESLRRSDSPTTTALLTPWEPEPPRIQTERLVLTFADDTQTAEYFRAIVGTDIFDLLVWDGPRAESELHDWSLKLRRGFARGGAHALGFAVIEKSSGLQIGAIGGGPAPKDPGRWTIGYSLAPRWHGRGYGTESVGGLVDYLFRERGAERVDAEVYTINPASRRLLEKLGFNLEGTLVQAQAKAGERRDLWVFGITRQVWERRKRA